MYVTIGELRHRVTAERAVTVLDDAGNLITTEWQPMFTVWAKVLPYSATIKDGATEQAPEVGYRIAMRYRTDIRVTDRLRWEGKTLLIVAPPYGKDGKREYLILEAKELVEDG
ncbi:MAG: phage head closure protein [Selenomonadaceae bacterium]|nr:phage head closure protein [Selenomonadaceae bacterium]